MTRRHDPKKSHTQTHTHNQHPRAHTHSNHFTHTSGNNTPQFTAGTRHAIGVALVLSTPIPATAVKHTRNTNQKRRRIRGTSMKKFERSTSFAVAPQVMLYENRCARSATDRWMLSPPKKKKLWRASV